MPRLARLGVVARHVAAAAAAPALDTAHPANQPLALGRGRHLRVLTEAQISLFWENGFLIVDNLLSAAEVASLAERTDAIAAGKTDNPATTIQIEPEMARDRAGGADVNVFTKAGLVESQQTALSGDEQVLSVRKLFNLCDTDDHMFAHASNPKVVDVIADLLGTDDIKVYGDQLFMKNPSVGSAIEWHQDSTSWTNIFPRDLVSAWTSIDEATVENGCLQVRPPCRVHAVLPPHPLTTENACGTDCFQFLPGSHRWGLIGATRGADGQEHSLSKDWGSDRWPAVPVELQPGSVSFHHSMTLHRSGANTSGKRRRGYAIHYMRASSIQEGDVTTGAKGKMAEGQGGYRSVRGRSFEGRV